MGFLKKLLGKQKKQPSSSYTKQQSSKVKVKPDFPIGDNHIDDPDIKTTADLGKLYPLPSGFTYSVDAEGIPYIERLTDRKAFTFLIEEGLLTFNEPVQRPDGKVIYNTTEVFKIEG
jgi:hypothetical protein